MTATAVEETTRLVLGVARLGEIDLTGWWGCHGLDRAGSYVLSRTRVPSGSLHDLERIWSG